MAKGSTVNLADTKKAVSGLMPGIMEDLTTLVSYPSCSFPGFPSEPVYGACAFVVDMLKRSGFEAEQLDLEAGGYPAVWAEKPGPEGAPTVLMYAHYDIQPAPIEQGWVTNPFEPVIKEDGRLYGRGAADDKSGIAIHVGSLRALADNLPVGVKVLIEGEEETGSHLDAYVQRYPDRFDADVMLIADMGNLECGRPVLTTRLRGMTALTVRVETVERPQHSGAFGGPAPDALMTLVRMLASLQDDAGNPAVEGLVSFDWPGADYPEQLYRELSGVLPDVDLIGDGSLATRLWSKPVINVIGIDAPSVAEAGNVLIPSASARVSMRIAPGAVPAEEVAKLERHLLDVTPWNAHVTIENVAAAGGFIAPEGGPAMTAAKAALSAAYGVEPSEVGSGGSIPLLDTLLAASPGAEFILWGAEDYSANIHGANESVHPDEIERMIVAQVLLLQSLADVR